ncbi:MAG: PEP/pyruvate-binding domain-containing protein [Bacteroidota bacterium]
MSKRQQLKQLAALRAPVPPFREIDWVSFQRKDYQLTGLRPPFAVRSTFSEEDGEQQSFAGHFRTELNVQPAALQEALTDVFASYPSPEGQRVIVQEMRQAEYSGVLFAYRQGVWWVDWAEGMGEQVVSGQVQPQVTLLPRFGRADVRWSKIFAFWQPPGLAATLRQPFVELSYWASRLLADAEAPHGLDIEFCVAQGQLYLLQARPITTPEEAQYVLSSANHKEILPAQPSALMTSLITASGHQLYHYYRDLDASLREQPFLVPAAGMPWINLSALYDTMTHWGLPTRLVADSVGAEDVYGVGLRPWRFLRKLPVFLRIAWQQQRVHVRTRTWVNASTQQLEKAQRERARIWSSVPGEALLSWWQSAQGIYVGLVQQMQVLTGAMSGPVAVLKQLGWVQDLAAYPSKSSDYLRAFQALLNERMSKEEFLAQFGHRGFYESDLGRPRFNELSAEEWDKLLRQQTGPTPTSTDDQQARWYRRPLLRYAARLVHRREWIRHESMRLFARLRTELLNNVSVPNPWSYSFRQLVEETGATDPGADFGPLALAPPSGWDMDTFLCNQHGRRLPLAAILSLDETEERPGLGIYPGRVEGQVWRVQQGDLAELEVPNFPSIILVADALDPGWIPYFTRVQAVAAHTGGLLSHASIILREARLPSVTQLPRKHDFETGDWVVLDGHLGTVVLLNK